MNKNHQPPTRLLFFDGKAVYNEPFNFFFVFLLLLLSFRFPYKEKFKRSWRWMVKRFWRENRRNINTFEVKRLISWGFVQFVWLFWFFQMFSHSGSVKKRAEKTEHYEMIHTHTHTKRRILQERINGSNIIIIDFFFFLLSLKWKQVRLF